MQKKLLTTSIVLILTAIILGAFERHYFEEKLGRDGVSSYNTAVKYQFWHGLALMILSLMVDKIQSAIKLTYWGFLIGVILFSGSIYVLDFLKTLEVAPIPLPVILITPLGGAVLILTWVYLLFKVIKSKF